MAGLKEDVNFKVRSPLALTGFVLLLSAFLLVSGWGHLISTITNRDLAQRVDVEVSGLRPEQAEEITFWFAGSDGDPVELTRYLSTYHWRTELWVPELRVAATREALAAIREIRVRVGGQQHVFLNTQVTAWQHSPIPDLIRTAFDADSLSLAIPLERYGPVHLINWPSNKGALGEVLSGFIVAPVAIFAVFLFWLLSRNSNFRMFVSKGLWSDLQPRDTNRRWMLYGFCFVAFSLIFLEWRQPFYFTQDDNYSQFLPVIAAASRTLFSGCLPLWDPYQYLGAPVFTIGVYALTYPFTYAAWAIATLVGNEYLTIEVWSIGHIVAGYLISVRMFARLGFRPATAACGAAGLVLSGFSLVFGRSWYYMLPILVWAPLLVLALERLIAMTATTGRAMWRWTTGTGIVIGVFFHAGNAQMWSYALIFFCVAAGLAVFAGRMSSKRAVWVLPAMIFGVAIAAPMLLMQMGETANIKRTGGLGQSIASAFPHLLLPLGSLVAHPDVWGLTQRSSRGEMFYVGFPFAVATAIGVLLLAAMVLLCRLSGAALRRAVGNNIWLICAGLAWIFALGHTGVLWTVMSKLPVFDKFNVPIKFLGFLVLFSVIGGGLIIERLLGGRKKATAVVLGCAFSLSLIHVGLATSSFYNYNGRPYPRLPQQFIDALNSEPAQRVLAVGPDRSIDRRTTSSLRNNYGTVAQVMTLEGYDPLVASRPEDIAAIRRVDSDVPAAAAAYGIGWVMVDEGGFRSRFGPDENAWAMETTAAAPERRLAKLKSKLTLAAWSPGYTLYRLAGSAPLAFAKGHPEVPLVAKANWSGIQVETAKLAANSEVVLTVTGRKWMTLSTEGSHSIKWSADKWGRVVFTVPSDAGAVSLAYSPPWGLGLAASAFLMLVAAALTWFVSAWQLASASRTLRSWGDGKFGRDTENATGVLPQCTAEPTSTCN